MGRRVFDRYSILYGSPFAGGAIGISSVPVDRCRALRLSAPAEQTVQDWRRDQGKLRSMCDACSPINAYHPVHLLLSVDLYRAGHWDGVGRLLYSYRFQHPLQPELDRLDALALTLKRNGAPSSTPRRERLLSQRREVLRAPLVELSYALEREAEGLVPDVVSARKIAAHRLALERRAIEEGHQYARRVLDPKSLPG